ncbi:MAG: UvrD/REP helicase [Bacteroidota bacterium]|jgi:ATP-dependent exoDNAse (exonuclease V) beta subunit|nr:UvrD/REP helicase [Bacteroidota bacterium]
MSLVIQNNFIVYKSSAGSGKTFTLVKEYLKLALADLLSLSKAYKGILAITFTNKAASEMKWRIIKALKEISSNSNAMISELVASELHITESELTRRAGIVLTEILHNYSDFSIGTIDSFTHRIIRTFALDLKLPINFQIETDSDTVFRKVISTLINNLGKDTLITNYLVQFSLSQIEDNKNWDPEQTLIDFIKEVNKEGVADRVNQLSSFHISDFEKIKKELKVVIKEYEAFLKERGERALALINSRQLTVNAFASGGSGIYNFFVKLAALKEKSEAGLFGANVLKTLQEDKWYGGKASAGEKTAIDSIKNELNQIANDVLSYLQDNEKRYNAFSLIYKNVYAMGLVNELAKLTNEYKSNENILFISEFNERISEVVNSEPTPFIFERLGDRYRHFLLDEFQDTSTMQWQNMLPLIENSLGSGNLNLIVGDGKQSIYRWRNADVEQFINLPYIHSQNKNILLAEREDALIRNFGERVLNKNYRSESVIVKFNNALFEYLANTVLNDDFKKIYHNQKQDHKPNERGYVSIDFPDSNDSDADTLNTALILKYIHQAIEDGYSYNDVCIIIRQNRHGSAVANFLIENGIPVVSADSLLLNNAFEVTVLLSFLRYLNNHKDLAAASVVVQYVLDCGLCTEENYIDFVRELNSSKTKNLFGILSECALKVDVLKLTATNLFECCLEIIDLLKLNEKNPQYIRFFLDEVLGFLQSNTSNTSLFLEWWERRTDKASVIIPEGISAVNIMTIHASKGLEFPVVITPYLAWDIEKTQSIWVDLNEDQLELPVALITTTKAADETVFQSLAEKERQQQALDSLNMLYVDFTRAVDRLHIISPKLKRKTVKNCHTWLTLFAETQEHYSPEECKVEFGMLTRKDSGVDHKSGLSQLKVPTLSFTRNADIVQIKGAATYESNEEVTRARDYGILVHFILSKINTYSDIEPVINSAVLSGDLSTDEAPKIKQEISQLLSIDSISPYYKPGVTVKNEMEILTATGEILRPDRVVIKNKDAIVIDYKTGKKNARKYHAQMQDYEYALLQLGYDSVKKVLLYIHDHEVEVII